MNIISNTGISTLTTGDVLTAATINSINSGTNNSINSCNYSLKSFCNVNLECGDNTKEFTLASAILEVPTDRRTPGICVRFRKDSETYADYVFNSSSVSDWTDLSMWKAPIDVYDGGTW